MCFGNGFSLSLYPNVEAGSRKHSIQQVFSLFLDARRNSVFSDFELPRSLHVGPGGGCRRCGDCLFRNSDSAIIPIELHYVAGLNKYYFRLNRFWEASKPVSKVDRRKLAKEH